MAISVVFRRLIRSLCENRLLPKHAPLLEIGEANWYGPIDRDELVGDVVRFVSDPARREALIQRVDDLVARQPKSASFDIVKVFYDVFFAPSEVKSIDFHGTPAALRFDLNHPMSVSRRFGVVINHGTAEHVFNIAQVFRSMHDCAAPAAMMIHECPFNGWINHGFYNLQPTLFFDLAEANRYGILGMFVEDLSDSSIQQIETREKTYELARAKRIPSNAMLFTVLIKDATDRPFCTPVQGYYRGSLSAAGKRAWKELR